MPARTVILEDPAGSTREIDVRADGQVAIGERTFEVRRLPDGSLRIGGDTGVRAWVSSTDGAHWVFVEGQVYIFTAPSPQATRRRRRGSTHHGSLSAPMPATVRRVHVAAGDAVRRGDVLIVLEAMKMEMPVKAAADGHVTAVNCREGEMVQAGQELIEVDED